MSEETKRKISKSLKHHYQGKSIWHTAYTHRQSYPERYFSKIFSDAERNYHVDRYFLDFAWPDKRIYIEIDGEQHYTEEGLKHDEERTARLNSYGWTLVRRIRWSEYQSLDKADKRVLVNELLDKVNLASFLTG